MSTTTFIESYLMSSVPNPINQYTIPTGESRSCNQQPNQPASDWRIKITSPPVGQTILTCALAPSITAYPPGTICPGFGTNLGKGPNEILWVTNEDRNTPVAIPGRRINCKYDIANITTVNDVNKWKRTFLNPALPQDVLNHNTQVYNNVLLPELCFQPAGPGECEPDNGIRINPDSVCAGSTGVTGGLTGCSRVTSRGEWSSICGAWSENQIQNNSVAFSERMRAYCGAPGNTCKIDCRCINRDIVDELYKTIASRYTGQDACWYQPCRNFRKYLIPDSVRVDPAACPPAACQIVVNAYNQESGSINIDIGEATIFCPGINGSTGTPNPPGGDPFANIESIWEQYQVYILIGLAIAGILLFILILYATYNNKGEPNATTDASMNPVIIPNQNPNPDAIIVPNQNPVIAQN